ncbi:MAG: DUF6029 family protein [Candidatus Marinimicrobia bacterium]|nr:DUF6029 family protein [Candidatus Neomarinimicrobiota bacterium]
MLTFLRIILVISIPLGLWAGGVSWNIGILTDLGRGEQIGLDYDYTETFLSGSMEFGSWYIDTRFEYSDPPEYGFQFQGLDRFLLRYNSDNWLLEFGDISAVFGRGLALNLYEDQAMDFDNQIKGLRLTTGLWGDHELDVLAGVNEAYHFYSPSSDLREPDGRAAYELVGAAGTINGQSGFWTGVPYLIGSRIRSDYLWREIDAEIGGISVNTVKQTQHVIQSGWGQSLYADSWDIYLEYNRTWKAFDYPLVSQNIFQTENGVVLQNSSQDYTTSGQALNLQLNWFPQWFTAMFEYKRYLNGPESAADKRDPLLLASKPLPWQLGPTGIRQHDISLLGNVTHPVDYGDELGWNLELQRLINDEWSLILNAAQTSQARDNRDLDQSPGIIPKQDITQNPWQEYFFEIEYSGEALSQRLFIAYTRSILSGASAAEILNHYTVVPAYLSWHPDNNLVLSSVIELQHSVVTGEDYSGGSIEGHEFLSTHIIGSIDLKHKYSASVIWDSSDDPNLISGVPETQHWISGELSLKPIDGLWIRASYGKEKGGVRCTGGVCRILNPFEGFRMTMEWRL